MRRFLDTTNLFRGLVLALVATLASAVYLAYEYLVVQRGYVAEQLAGGAFAPRFTLDIVGAFVALFISATAGFAWANGRRLVGFGSWRRVRRDLALIVPIGAAIALLSALVLDRTLYKPLLTAVRNPFKPLATALFEETICRWGILAIAFRLSRSVPVAVVLSAAFSVIVVLPVVQRHGATLETWALVAIIGIKFLLAIGYAVFFAHKGLLSTMALRFVAALPAPFLAIV
ncbi:MAG: hypothetical protein JW889_01170 [Verrucomicrobia bacterium]|nr:hypothetical protein [Verrucomicrobiota bacterium]